MPNEDKLCIKHTEQLKNIKDIVVEIKDDIKQHIKESIVVRDTVTTNKTSITWLTWGIRGLYGSLIIGVMSWIIRGIVKTSFF